MMTERLKKRIIGAEETIRKGLVETSKPYLSCSWGKDSITLLSLVQETCGIERIAVVFMNSGYDLPELYSTRDRLLKEWHITNYHEIKSPIDYVTLLAQYGLRNITRTDQQQRDVVKIIKKDNITKWAEENGYNGFLWGMRSDESVGRKMYFRKFGAVHTLRGFVRISPLMNWTQQDVWQYIEDRSIPYPAFYDKNDLLDRKEIRSSGWLTADGAQRGRIVWLKSHYPDQYAEFARLFPEVKHYV